MCTKLHALMRRRTSKHACLQIVPHYAPSLRCCGALCGVNWVSISNNAKLTSPVVVWPLWSHETLRMSGCADRPYCTTWACESKLHQYIYTKVIACLDVYQAALMRRRAPKHACMSAVYNIYISIWNRSISKYIQVIIGCLKKNAMEIQQSIVHHKGG
jgi:hypothetical protein